MAKNDVVTLHLTVSEARLLYGIVDGAADAGACEDGFTEEEHEASRRMLDQIDARLRRLEKKGTHHGE